MGIPAPEAAAWFATYVELAGGVLLIAGLLTPLVGLLVAGNMAGAAWFAHRDAGVLADGGGWELVGVIGLLGLFYVWPPVYAVLAWRLAPELAGPGRADTLVVDLPGLALPGTLGTVLGAVALGGAFAAFLSTASGLTVAVSGVLARDLVPGVAGGGDARAVTRFRVATLGALVLATTACEAGGASESDLPGLIEPEVTSGIDYVALGDSFSAGPFIGTMRNDPEGCARSRDNYPAFLADWLDVASYTDVTCSAAVTADLYEPMTMFDGNTARPQLDAVTAETDLVTIGMGGNDFSIYDSLIKCQGGAS